MSPDAPARMVYLKVVSATRSPDWISRNLRTDPDSATAKGEIPFGSVTGRPLAWNRWELRESGGDSTELDALLRAIHERIEPIRDKIAALPRDECSIELVITARYTSRDEASYGFHLNGQLVILLAEIDASIDVDLYIIGDDE